MALLTMIARVIDGLPLVGTMQDDEQVMEEIYSLLSLIIPKLFLCLILPTTRLDAVLWNIKIKPKCCFANWAHTHPADVA